MTTRVLSSRPGWIRQPGVEPVSGWPGLPVVPGAVRRPVPMSATRIHLELRGAA
jgi:hypothetical protein